MTPKIIYASDYRGIDLRKLLVQQGLADGYNVKDIGIPDGSPLDYIDISKLLAEELRQDPAAIGVITCGSGQGVSMALNRYTHVRASVCRTVDDATQTREKLNANVICLGSKQNTLDESIAMVRAFVDKPFEGGKHAGCVQKLAAGATQHFHDGVNLIVRALIMHEGHMLMTVVTDSNKDFASDLHFLPGGHVEYNEATLSALKREIKEEMNLSFEGAKFIGALECSWDRKGKPYHEINVAYQIDIKGLSLANPPEALDHKFHKFIWVPVAKLDEIKLLPESLKPIIKGAVSGGSFAPFYSQGLS